VPLLADGEYAGRKVAKSFRAESPLDIAPTLLDPAGVYVPEIMDGSSLVSLIDEPDDDRTVAGEYLAEGAAAPNFMIRRHEWNFIWSATDRPQLYNLADDPNELTNLAEDPSNAVDVTRFEREVEERWNAEQIDTDVRASQRARVVIDTAMRQGRFSAWDYQPTTNAAEHYVRNHLDLNDLERVRRA
jgi:choline-sulfatase